MRLVLGIGIVVGLLAVAAFAQEQVFQNRVVHEYVDVDRIQFALVGETMPEATRFDREPGEPPDLSMERRPEELVFDESGPVGEERLEEPWGPLNPTGAESSLDERTDRVESLHYFPNFEPSVIPYKRMVSQREIIYRSGQYSAANVRPEFRDVRVGGEPEAEDDVFWGSFMMQLRPGRVHPIASVAPDQRILEVVTEPSVGIRFQRDQADNYYVVGSYDGLVRINFRVAVNRGYFQGPLSETTWDEVDRWAGSHRRPLPTQMLSVSERVLEHIGVSRQMPAQSALLALVEHYRDFEGRPFPPELAGGDLYEAISVSQVGVCRHRSLGFMISALGLGIPTRYVYNEAHAFVEVRWPEVGWRRIDLGGAADELRSTGGASDPVHETGPDELPQPPRYVEELDRMESSGSARSSGPGAQGRQGSDREGGESHEVGADGAEEFLHDAPFGEAEVESGRRVVLEVQAASAEVLRGSQIQVFGTIHEAESGYPVEGATVEIYLGPVGTTNIRRATRIGQLTSNANGHYEGNVTVPDSQQMGRWKLFAHLPQDEIYAPDTGD